MHVSASQVQFIFVFCVWVQWSGQEGYRCLSVMQLQGEGCRISVYPCVRYVVMDCIGGVQFKEFQDGGYRVVNSSLDGDVVCSFH